MNRFVILLVAFAAVAAAGRSNERLKDGGEDSPVPYDDVTNHHTKYARSLTENGVWTFWDVGKGTFPPQAVNGGNDQYGPSFVIQADHTLENGVHVGKLLGKYFPQSNAAYVSYDGKEYLKTHFEILLHENHAWTDKSDTRPLIPGPGRDICRILMSGWKWTPGFVDGTTCRVAYNGKQESSTDYQTLRRNCY